MALTHITLFPQEILEQIFRHFDWPSLVNFACCSRKCYNSSCHILYKLIYMYWHKMEKTQELQSLKHLKFCKIVIFTNCDDIPDEDDLPVDVKRILAFSSPNHRNRMPKWDDISVNFRRIIDQCDPYKLINVRIEDTSMMDKELIFVFEKLYNITVLTLFCCYEVTSLSLKLLSNLKCLNYLHLVCCYIEDDDFSNLNLQGLSLFNCPRVTDDSLKHISCMTRLKELTFIYTGDVRDPEAPIPMIHIEQLQTLVLLEKLDISYANLNDEQGLVTLTETLNSLKVLNTSGISITHSLSYISNLSSLTHLTMASCSISDEQLLQLLPLKSLCCLNIAYNNDITDVGMENISKLVSLDKLVLQRCWRVTDEGILSLTSLLSLRSINLAGCSQLTNGCLIYLSKLPSLKEITVDSETNITDAALEQMQVYKKDWEFEFED